MIRINPLVLGLAFLTFFCTLLGGTLAIRFRKVIHYFFAFASGSLIGVIFFDLLPESLEMAQSTRLSLRTLMVTIVVTFLFYSFLERYFLTHHHEEEGPEHGHIMGPLGAGGLIVHSFLDGAAIGTAFQANASVGLIVALAVIMHDFTDGINTVTVMLKNHQHVQKARFFLWLDALAPLLGVLATSLVSLDRSVLALILAGFVGEFLYIGIANLMPETYTHSYWKMSALMMAGALFIFFLTALM